MKNRNNYLYSQESGHKHKTIFRFYNYYYVKKSFLRGQSLLKHIIHCIIAMATVKINGYTHNENTLDKEFDKEGQKCT